MKGKRAFRILFIDGPNLNVLGEREKSDRSHVVL